MKPTGIVRKLDDLGRIVIPKEVRTLLGIKEKDALEVFVDNNDTIILQKYVANMTCLVTGEVSDNNHRLLNGDLILSDEGARLLVEEIEKTTGKCENVQNAINQIENLEQNDLDAVLNAMSKKGSTN